MRTTQSGQLARAMVANELPNAVVEGETRLQLSQMPVKPLPRTLIAALSLIMLIPDKPIELRVFEEIPFSALAEVATQTIAATSVDKITLLILVSSPGERKKKG